jgi:DNA-binding FrmR family transcriptional regulator
MKSPQDRLSIIIGQLNGIKKMMDKNEDCIKLITQLRASRSGIESVIDTIIANKFDTCMKDLKPSDKKLLINIKKYVTTN